MGNSGVDACAVGALQHWHWLGNVSATPTTIGENNGIAFAVDPAESTRLKMPNGVEFG